MRGSPAPSRSQLSTSVSPTHQLPRLCVSSRPNCSAASRREQLIFLETESLRPGGNQKETRAGGARCDFWGGNRSGTNYVGEFCLKKALFRNSVWRQELQHEEDKPLSSGRKLFSPPFVLLWRVAARPRVSGRPSV